MKFLKRFVLLILLLALLSIGVGYVLPESAHVERDIRIDAPPETVFPHVNDYRLFNQWSPWAEQAPGIEYDYGGPDTGVGARMSWHSEDPEIGSGSSLITQSKPPVRVTTRLNFSTRGGGTAWFDIEAAGNGSRVIWGFDTEFGNDIIQRYFGLMLDRWIGRDYERGLQNLKTLVETQTND